MIVMKPCIDLYRYISILALLKRHECLTVDEIAEMLNNNGTVKYSRSNVARLLVEMKAKGLVYMDRVKKFSLVGRPRHIYCTMPESIVEKRIMDLVEECRIELERINSMLKLYGFDNLLVDGSSRRDKGPRLQHNAPQQSGHGGYTNT